MRERILIIADTHLGRPHQAARSADALRSLWRGADHVIVNGDVAEISHPRHRRWAAIEALRLRDLCEADGVSLTLLAGNHDPLISPLRHLLLADGLVFVTHGHVLHPAVAPWSPRASVMRDAHALALVHLRNTRVDPLEASFEAATIASGAEWRHLERQSTRSSFLRMLWRPHALLRVLHYWRIMPRLAAAFLRRHAPDARFIVLGHTHRPGIWSIDDRIIINTGGFGFPGTPWAAMLEDHRLSILPIRWNRGRYELADNPLRRFMLPARAATCSSTAIVNGAA